MQILHPGEYEQFFVKQWLSNFFRKKSFKWNAKGLRSSCLFREGMIHSFFSNSTSVQFLQKPYSNVCFISFCTYVLYIIHLYCFRLTYGPNGIINCWCNVPQSKVIISKFLIIFVTYFQLYVSKCHIAKICLGKGMHSMIVDCGWKC